MSINKMSIISINYDSDYDQGYKSETQTFTEASQSQS